MKFKMAVPDNLLTGHQIGLIEKALADHLLEIVVKNFPNWKKRSEDGNIYGGEIILQATDPVRHIKGLRPGIHVTISLISYMEGRDFDGLAKDVIRIIKQVRDDDDILFMTQVGVFVQMSLDRPVVRIGTSKNFSNSGDGVSLLEYNE
jgi:hypothetical protein